MHYNRGAPKGEVHMKQFRLVYAYKSADGRVNGAGACFVLASNEATARAVFARDMPLGTITELREEADDPLRIYERPVRS